ncbi:MAG: RlmE family RNA methyltransferase [Spirochaetales bacterium]|uniref:Ribosomal RNA large subunit methyltransferase E n=1 Tax=Candidatus Thalassospirochaeta sargassi TaxID=3119039 RepID=A0AAJ1IBY8_9SPIO|nr:RlmE family RNA methyltransferase [Spirochaetales bacterium]
MSRQRSSKRSGSKRSELDHYSLRAKKEGYPARSVYKLEELNSKFRIFNRNSRILDIGAAPGSWTLYCLRKTAKDSLVAGIDLKDLTISKNDARLFFIKGDFFDEKNQSELLAKGPYDAVISDAAPATTGNRTVDAGRSFSLAAGIIGIAGLMLVPGGNLTIKIFQGGDEKELVGMLAEIFETAKIFKPKACRRESFETYIVGLNYKGSDEE